LPDAIYNLIIRPIDAEGFWRAHFAKSTDVRLDTNEMPTISEMALSNDIVNVSGRRKEKPALGGLGLGLID
jgi:hypothetical protein